MSRRKHQPPAQSQRSQPEKRQATGNRPQAVDRSGKNPPKGKPRPTPHAAQQHDTARHAAAPESRRESQRESRPAPQQEAQQAARRDPRRGPRDPNGPVWLYGSHACQAALANPARYCRRLLLTREARDGAMAALAGTSPVQPEIVDRARLDALLPPGAVHQGIALQVEPLEDPGVEALATPLAADAPEIVLALDQVTDPRNVGAILRSAAAFGARALIVTDRHAPEATGALAKAASGGLEVVPMLRVTNLVRALDLLAGYGFWRVGLDATADRSLAQAVAGVKRLVLVMGAEDEGLRRLTREHCDFLARLPMTGAVESLNVSAAAAIALYEAARRQG